MTQHGGPPGWLEESDTAGRDFCCDGRSMPPSLTDRTTGRQPPPLSSVLWGIISKRRSYWPDNYSLEKNQVPRELALIAISLACLVAQWYSYGGSWKWVTILSILVGMIHLLSAICFCISSYVHQQLHSIDCQHFVHYISLVLFTFLRTPHGYRFHFWKEPTIFKIV